MLSRSIFAIITILALATLACAVTVDLPVDEIRTSALQTTPVQVSIPTSGIANLTLEFGAGELKVQPGGGSALVDGVATYNVARLEPKITVAGGNVKVSTGNLNVNGFPSIRAKDFKNEWDLKLGDQPMNLMLNSGAYQGRLELGGLSLHSLEVNDGAADVSLNFSQPNRIAMEWLNYATGASHVTLTGLANANFSQMSFRSGMGEYTLDFSGSLQRDGLVNIESGASSVKVIVPVGVNAVVQYEGAMAGVELGGAWHRTTSGKYNLQGSGPTLTIIVKLGAGSLTLEN
jgi:hypothetical protein